MALHYNRISAGRSDTGDVISFPLGAIWFRIDSDRVLIRDNGRFSAIELSLDTDDQEVFKAGYTMV